MGRDTAQISQEIDQTRAQLATTIAALGSTDVKGELTGRAQEIREVAVAKGKAKAQELQPILRARAEAKVRELKPMVRDRAQAKAQEVKTTAIATARAKADELRPVVIARAKEKAAEVKPVLLASAKAKAEEIRPVLIARATAVVEDLKAKARAAASDKVQETKGAALERAAELGAVALVRAKSKPAIGGACGALAAGLVGLAARRAIRRRSRTRLQRVTVHADVVNRQAIDGMRRVRERAAEGIHRGAEVPNRLGRRLRRG